MLLEAEGSVELIHIADTLPGLKHNTGVSNWINADKKGNLYKRYWIEYCIDWYLIIYLCIYVDG